MEYELYHHGILGMHWGIRRYQNKDGTWTAAGKKRYGGNEHALEVDRQIQKYTKASNRQPLTLKGINKQDQDKNLAKKAVGEAVLKSDKSIQVLHAKTAILADEYAKKKAQVYKELKNKSSKLTDPSELFRQADENKEVKKLHDEHLKAWSKEMNAVNSAVDSLLGKIGNEPVSRLGFSDYSTKAEAAKSFTKNYLGMHLVARELDSFMRNKN